MFFKTPAIETQWAELHPDLRVLLHDLDEWLWDSKMERITITDAIRSLDEQERLYTEHYLSQRITEAEAKAKARRKFSWHLVSCAADFRHTVKPYTDEEMSKIGEWLNNHCAGSEWEVLFHTVGFGKHWHVAKRDFVWRRLWEQKGGVA